jgi:hypothetical protein
MPCFLLQIAHSLSHTLDVLDKMSILSPYQLCRGPVQDLLKNIMGYIRTRIGSGAPDSVTFNPLFGPSLASINKEFESSTQGLSPSFFPKNFKK